MPFRGSVAVATGQVTPARLLGPRYRALFHDVYIAAADEEPTPVEWALGAALLVRGRGVLGGWSAAELLGASCAPHGAPAEVVVPGGGVRSRAGLKVRFDRLGTDEVTAVDGVPVTTCWRTALDLGRRAPLLDAIIAVDALSRVGGFAPAVLLDAAAPGMRGLRLLERVVRRADNRSGSPMETRIRLAIEDGRLVVPVLQHPVGPYALDLAYPGVKLAMEYDGREHLTQERARRDLRRQAYLTARGWTVLRFRAADVLGRPRTVAAEVRGTLIEIGRERGLTLAQLTPLLVN